MSLSLDGAIERFQVATATSPPLAVIDCQNASWTYKYFSGYSVVLRGPLNATVVFDASSGKYFIKVFQFEANTHEKLISVDSIALHPPPNDPKRRLPDQAGHINSPSERSHTPSRSQAEDSRIHYESVTLPAEPVNAFGIPQVTMRCLEVCVLFTFIEQD